MDERAMSAKLCYATETWAFFTTQELAKQDGDDWNDAPYSCNAGYPYEVVTYDKGPGEIYRIAWDGPFELPPEKYSVDDINAGNVAWLGLPAWNRTLTNGVRPIMAGTTMRDFIDIVIAANGTIYLPS